MTETIDLERKALGELRQGDLNGARETLVSLLELQPSDQALMRRVQQLDLLIRQRRQTLARIQAEPLRYANAYIDAGRRAEGLQLLRAALARDPNNEGIRKQALELARELEGSKAPGLATSGPSQSPPSSAFPAQAAEEQAPAQVVEISDVGSRSPAAQRQIVVLRNLLQRIEARRRA